MDQGETPDDRSGDEHVQVAYAPDEVQAQLIQGLLENGGIASYLQPIGLDGRTVGSGVLGSGSQGVTVRADDAEAAKRLLDETLVEEAPEDLAEIANARHLEDARGRRPRSYGLIGAYARIYLWALVVFGLAFAVFMLSR